MKRISIVIVSFIFLLFLIQFPSDVNANDDNVLNDEDIINYFLDYYSIIIND